MIEGSEECDDGNVNERDGCTANCKVDCGWHCPVVGKPCVWTTCGNGVLNGDEECDSEPECGYDCKFE